MTSNSFKSFDVEVTDVEVKLDADGNVRYTLDHVAKLAIVIEGFGGHYEFDVGPDDRTPAGSILVTIVQEQPELLSGAFTLQVGAVDTDDRTGEIIYVSAAFFSASAGEDDMARDGDTVALHATFTGETGLTQITWSQVSGPGVDIADPSSKDTTFVPETVGTYVMKLAAVDASGVIDVDLVSILVVDEFTVDAGESGVIVVDEPVQLRGLAAGGTGQASFAWIEISDHGVIIENPNSRVAGFVAPETGEYEFELTATDEIEGPASDRVIYLAVDGLTVFANAPAQAELGATIQLQGQAAGGLYPYAFRWTQTDGPEVEIEDATNQTALVSLETASEYTFELRVEDSTGSDDATDSVTVSVPCVVNSDCDDGLFCNGSETCIIPNGETEGICTAGTNPCEADEVCSEENGTCPTDECETDVAWERTPVEADFALGSPALAFHDGALYTFGGTVFRDNRNDQYTSQVARLDLSSHTWSQAGTLPYGRRSTWGSHTTVVGDTCYITPEIGPTKNNGWGTHGMLIEYDFVSETAAETADFSGNGNIWACGIASTSGGAVYAFGGWTGSGVSKVFKYDSAVPEMAQISGVALTAGQPNSVCLDASGGVLLFGVEPAARRRLQIFDPTSDSLVYSEDVIPVGMERSYISWTTSQGNTYLGSTFNSDVYHFDSATQVFTLADFSLPTPSVGSLQSTHAFDPTTDTLYLWEHDWDGSNYSAAVWIGAIPGQLGHCDNDVCTTNVDCDDKDACTTDTFDVDTCKCSHEPLVCDDGLFCTGTETCDSATGCVDGTGPCGPGTGQCNEDTESCQCAVISTFTSSDDGWLIRGDAQGGSGVPDSVATGGNPDGHISADDDALDGTWYFQAPSTYHRDFSGALGFTLTFDLKQSLLSGQFDTDDVILSGGDLTIAFDTESNPGTDWTSYVIRLDETAGWRLGSLTGVAATRSDILTVLANLIDLQIRGEFASGFDTGALDNVALNWDCDAPCPPTEDCNDGNACTTDTLDVDTCECSHDALICDDEKACTDNSCDPELGCVFKDLCEEGTVCVGGECISDPDTIHSSEWLTGAIDSVVDVDTDTFTGQVGDLVFIQVNRTSGGLDPQINLFPPGSGDMEARDDPSGGIALLFAHPLRDSGQYKILLRDQGADETGEYIMSLLNLSEALTSLEDPDGGPIAFDETRTGSIDPVVDMDAYTFPGEAGQRVTIQANRTSGGLDPQINLFPPGGGDREARDDPSGGIALLFAHPLAESGQYTILIRDQGADETGEYIMSLSVLP